MKISVITVCLNSIKTIEQTIRSVITQNYPNIEYIIIDGKSTDGTLDIIQKYEEYISQWVSEPDKGIYDAMNKGLKMATGDYIAFLNSDDWYEEGAIRCVADDIMDNKTEIACYNTNICYGSEAKRWNNKLAKDIKNIRISMIYSHQAIFASKSVFDRYGDFDVRYKICADFEWILRAYNNGVTIKYQDIVVVNFRAGGFSFSNEIKLYREEEIIVKTALIKLKEEKKISKDELYETLNRIQEYYEKFRLRKIAELALKEEWISRDSCMQSELRKILPEARYSIFGSGNFGTECCILLQQIGCETECFWDNDPKKWGKFCRGICIKSPKEIQKGKTKIIISVKDYTDEIEEQLMHMGLERDIDYLYYSNLQREAGRAVKKYLPENVLGNTKIFFNGA